MKRANAAPDTPEEKKDARTRLLDAALAVIRTKGFSATRVDELCAAAGVAKGGFFHHFKSKEALGVAAADYWNETTSSLFESAPYHRSSDPLTRFLDYLQFRRALIAGEIPEFTCLVGTMTQEVYETSPDIRDACWRSISGHAETLEADIKAAMKKYNVDGMSAKSLALYTQATIQGAFILAKAKDDPKVAIDCIDHLIRYVELLFGRKGGKASRK
ncbi:MAG: TetR/AcrR family transcriptional regulator [Parvularculaceae bacterium]